MTTQRRWQKHTSREAARAADRAAREALVGRVETSETTGTTQIKLED